MKTNLLTIPRRRSIDRSLSFIRRITLIFAMLTMVPWNTYAKVSVNVVRKHAEQGDAKAQFNLGYCYANGDGVPKDMPEAVTWWRRTAEQGDLNAQFCLGGCYANGDGVPKDLTEAVTWWRRAAEQGDAKAQFFLGLCYAKGDGVSKDMTEAAQWYRKAAEQGIPQAQKALREMGQ